LIGARPIHKFPLDFLPLGVRADAALRLVACARNKKGRLNHQALLFRQPGKNLFHQPRHIRAAADQKRAPGSPTAPHSRSLRALRARDRRSLSISCDGKNSSHTHIARTRCVSYLCARQKAAQLTVVSGGPCSPICTGNLEGVFFGTNRLITGSFATGGTFAPGGKFTIVGFGVDGVTKGTLFQGTFSSATWTVSSLHHNGVKFVFSFTGTLEGTVTSQIYRRSRFASWSRPLRLTLGTQPSRCPPAR